jgi:hypothetical protein
MHAYPRYYSLMVCPQSEKSEGIQPFADGARRYLRRDPSHIYRSAEMKLRIPVIVIGHSGRR